MKANLILALTIILIFISCKKEKTDIDVTGDQTTFVIPSSIGSYWTYQWYRVDSNGVESNYGSTETESIAGDTLINGSTYTKYNRTYMGLNSTVLRRDSSGYIINQNGYVFYSYLNFDDVINTGSFPDWDWYLKMVKQEGTITVPAGTFTSIQAMQYNYNPNGGTLTNCGDTFFILGSWYASGIGRILEKTGFNNELINCEGYLERRLIEYHIE